MATREPAFKIEIAGFPISLRCTRKGRYTVVYGKQIETGLDYLEAATAIGTCIMHALMCEGRLDNGQ